MLSLYDLIQKRQCRGHIREPVVRLRRFRPHVDRDRVPSLRGPAATIRRRRGDAPRQPRSERTGSAANMSSSLLSSPIATTRWSSGSSGVQYSFRMYGTAIPCDNIQPGDAGYGTTHAHAPHDAASRALVHRDGSYRVLWGCRWKAGEADACLSIPCAPSGTAPRQLASRAAPRRAGCTGPVAAMLCGACCVAHAVSCRRL